MAGIPPSAVISSALGISLHSAFVGCAIGLSYVAVPSLLVPATPTKSATSSPKPATPSGDPARQWQKMYNLGKVLGPLFSFSGSAAFLHAAMRLPGTMVEQKRLFFLSSALGLAIVPFTFTVMARTNSELHRRADLISQGREEDHAIYSTRGEGLEGYQTKDLLKWWATLNMMRGLLLAVGVTGAIWALVW